MKKNQLKKWTLIAVLSVLPTTLLAKKKPQPPVKVNHNLRTIVVTAWSPFPLDITDETQARALARDASVVRAQEALLTDILKMKTKSGRPLSVAEVPSLDIQNELRTMVKEAPVKKETWENQVCTIVLEFDKKKLKKILKEN